MNRVLSSTEILNGKMGMVYSDVRKSVDDVINYMGNDISFAMPLALGKPVMFINELYRRAKEDPSIKLNIVTALALEKPAGKSDLERRFLTPLVERVFAGYPDFEYMLDFRAGKLPKNIAIYEFFNKAGGYMDNPEAQRNHLHSNYAHVVRDAIDFGCNVFGQLLGCREIDGKMVYSMGCNTCISVEAKVELGKLRRRGEKIVLVGEANPNLPFMYGDAVVEGESYDIILQGTDFNYPLFGPPKDSVSIRDHAIGLHVSALVKDGGTLQVGIGALGDAIASSLNMRQNENEAYNRVLDETGISGHYSDLISKIGGTGTFDLGLYGSSEMFVDAFLQLYRSGVLKRKVYDNLAIMKLINEEKLSDNNIPDNVIELLIEEEGIYPHLRKKDFDMLLEFGILKEGLMFRDGFITDGNAIYNADFSKMEHIEKIKPVLGKSLKNGKVILGAFFLGPRSFYEALNSMSEEERMVFGMSGVEKVNQLYGGEDLRALQRKDGRFINTGMMAHLLGSITSDQLEDGRLVSGIGGQYNFVSMAHALPDARLIMMIRSTRGSGKNVKSNIVYKYGHVTIPRHLRDIVVTEYGIADIRGLQDSKIIEELLKVADSRFQEELIREAKRHGKLSQDFKLSEEYRNNTPEKLAEKYRSYQKEGHFATFPFGTDFTQEEILIGASLKNFKNKSKGAIISGILIEMFKSVPPKSVQYLKRMGLDNPSNRKEKIMQKILLSAMRSNGVV